MPEEIVIVKDQLGRLIPATGHDSQISSAWKIGAAKKMKVLNMSPRVLAYHQRYWAGLIELTLQYWEPDNGLITWSERRTFERCLKWYADHGHNADPLRTVFDAYMADLTESRKGKIHIPQATPEQLHRWIKEKAGYFDYERTPDGIVKRLKSINFASMNDPEFREYYKRAFNVCWVHVLAQTFDNEEQAESAAHQLLSLC